MTAAALRRVDWRERAALRFAGVWRLLDLVYLWAGYLAALAMVAVFVITMIQVAGRLLGFSIRGGIDLAGYFMAASAFLAFAHAFTRGAHVRIDLFLGFAGRLRPLLELTSFAASALMGVWFSYYSWSMAYWSWKLGDVSQGLDATPLWIPQISMAAGMSLFALAVADHGLRLVLTGKHGLGTTSDPV